MTVPIERLAEFLLRHLPWLTHRPEVDEFAADVADCAGRMRGLVEGPREQRFLGPCGTELGLAEPEWEGAVLTETCDGDVYGVRGAAKGKCRTCGAEHDQADRSAWLDGEVRQHAYRPAHIADAYGVKANTIVKWHGRGKLTAYWHTEAGLTVPWTDCDEAEAETRGPKVFYVGDVLDLAAGEKLLAHERQVQRERRAAKAEDERLSA